MRRLTASRVPLAVFTFLLVMTVGNVLDGIFQPQHAPDLLLTYGVCLLIGAIHVFIVWRFPTTTIVVAVLGANVAALAIVGFATWVHGNAEMCALMLSVLLAGVVLLYPFDLVGQVTASAGGVVGYVFGLHYGMVPALPAPYGICGLLMAAAIVTLGARLMDTHRFAAYREATHQTALARENGRLMEHARQANEAKSDFLATVSHELRTPLSTILGYTDLLLDGTLDEPAEQHGTLQRIRQQATEVVDMFQGMLDLNRLEAGGISFVVDTFQVHDIIDALRDSLPAAWYKHGVHLDWRVPDEAMHVHSDRTKIEMILRNLIHNALKYTQEGTVTVTAAAAEPRSVRFVVSDTGEGMARDDLLRIFEMFAQGRGAPRDSGVGLGLYIVKRLTEALGGRVSVESQPGAGTSFSILLPLDIGTRPGAVHVVRT